MEESDVLDQQVFHRQSRSAARKSRGSEQIVREIPASSLNDENPISPGYEKPVKVRFSLGAKPDRADTAPKSRSRSKRERRTSQVKMESDEEELVVDEPSAVISSPPRDQSLVLRMKLNIDPSGVSSFGSVEMPESYHQSVCCFGFFTFVMFFYKCYNINQLPSLLSCCWLGDTKGIWSVEKDVQQGTLVYLENGC